MKSGLRRPNRHAGKLLSWAPWKELPSPFPRSAFSVGCRTPATMEAPLCKTQCKCHHRCVGTAPLGVFLDDCTGVPSDPTSAACSK